MEFRYTLTHSSGSHILSQDPDGWQDIRLNLTRDGETHGIDEAIDTPLKFNCQGAGKEWILDIINSYGVDTEVSLTIEVYCDRVWEAFYTGLLELMNYTNTDDYFECNIIQTGFYETFLNRIDTDVDLFSLEGVDGQTLEAYTKAPFDFTLHSRAIRMRSGWGYEDTTIDEFVFSNSNLDPKQKGFPTSDTSRVFLQPPFNRLEDEINRTNLLPKYYAQNETPFSDDDIQDFLTPALDTAGNFLIEDIEVNLTWDVSGDFTEYPTSPMSTSRAISDASLFLIYGNDLESATGAITLGTIPGHFETGNSSTKPFNFTGSQTFTLPKGNKIWLYWSFTYLVSASGSSTNEVTFFVGYDTADISIVSDTTTTASTCKAFGIHEAFSRVTESITGQATPFQSELLGRTNSQPVSYADTGCLGLNVITGGYNIRQIKQKNITKDPRPLFVSFSKLYNSINAINPIGYGQDNGVIRVEDISYFYQDTAPILEFDNVTVTETNAAEFFVNNIEIGYDKWESEDVGGIDETNTVHEYATRIKNNKNPLSLLGELITSSYAIEHTRRSRVKKETDWKYDEDTCLIATSGTLLFAEKDANFSSISNIIRPDTTYNLRYTPARNFVRWLKVINSCLLKYNTDIIKFASGEGNIEAVSTQTDSCDGSYGNNSLQENQNFSPFIGGSTSEVTPLWQPLFYEFQYPLTYAEYKTLKANRYKTVTVNGVEGYVWSVDFDFNNVSLLKILAKY